MANMFQRSDERGQKRLVTREAKLQPLLFAVEEFEVTGEEDVPPRGSGDRKVISLPLVP